MKHSTFLLAALLFLATGCRKQPVVTPDPVDPAPAYGNLNLAFRNVVGSQSLVLGSQIYTTAMGDSFTVSTLKYFISNIELLDASGNAVKPEPTYNLINQEGSRAASADGFKTGSYTKVRFLIGVDSTRNTSGAQSGDLDPAAAALGMFWDWNTGYIMAMMEGASPQAVTGPNPEGKLTFHMGGFKGVYNVLRTVTLDLPSPAIIREGRTTELHINADLAQWFTSPNTVRFSDVFFAMGGKTASQIADNYMDGFKVTEVHNE